MLGVGGWERVLVKTTNNDEAGQRPGGKALGGEGSRGLGQGGGRVRILGEEGSDGGGGVEIDIWNCEEAIRGL
jgi:hypothetical protein